MIAQPVWSGESSTLAANAMDAAELNNEFNFILANADTSKNFEAPMVAAISNPSSLVTGTLLKRTFFLTPFRDLLVDGGGAAAARKVQM